ncbi:unnamed protein product [Sphagnum jensenii]|uniref:Uncharacterized protein n=2 Tax=Sphagnum TaxID=13804 RepID=A0ABP1A9G3_9BRYO
MCLISLCICDWTLSVPFQGLIQQRPGTTADEPTPQAKGLEFSENALQCRFFIANKRCRRPNSAIYRHRSSDGRMQRPQQSHAHADLLLLLPLLSCKHRKAAFSGMAVTQPQPPLTTARLWNVLLGEAYWTWTFRASEYGLESSGDDYSGGAEFAEGPRETWKMGVGRVQRRQPRKQRWKLQVVTGDGILPPPTWCGGGAPPGPRNLDLFIRLPATRR